MNAFSPTRYRRLLALLKEQRQLVDRFLELSRKQGDLLAAEDVDAFLQNLSQRQAIIDQADTFRAELDALVTEYLSLPILTAPEKADRKKVLDLRGQIRALFAEIQQVDRQTREQAAKLMESFKQEIRAASVKKEGVIKYTQGSAIFGSEYFDKLQ